MKKAISLALSTCIVLGGCASASKDIAAANVSPAQYQGYNCEQLVNEAERIHVRVVQLGGRLDQAAGNDKALLGVGAILFWPVLFGLGGNQQQEADYARLKGEIAAIKQSALLKQCPDVVVASK